MRYRIMTKHKCETNFLKIDETDDFRQAEILAAQAFDNVYVKEVEIHKVASIKK